MEMKAFLGFAMLLATVKDNAATCTGSDADRVYYCKSFQKDYSEGTKTLIFEERDVGLINSTVFSSPNLKSVVTLTLTGSRIHTIESGAFEHFSSLITLELQNNRLTALSPFWFRDPTVLEQLNAAGNLIGQLHPGMLDGYSALKVLNLSRNEISKIGSFAALSKLSSLDLSYNKISSLDRKAFTSLNATLKLHGNPWNCSCGQKDFILFLQELVNTSRLNDSTLVTCRYPPDLNGVIVWNISEMNCSTFVLSPSSAAGLHQIVLPALFVVLGGVFFSLSMWMIVCFLKSQCKNKVTNRADSKCNLHSSMEQEEGHVRSGDNHPFESHLKGTSEEGSFNHLHVRDLNNRDIENPRSISLQSHQPFQFGSHKTEDELDRLVYSGLKAEKCVREGISKCASAPILLPCASKSSKGAVLKAEEPTCPTTTKVLPDVAGSSTGNSVPAPTAVICPTTTTVRSDLTIFPNKDPAHLGETQLSCGMTGLLGKHPASIPPADKCYDLGIKLKTEAEINRKPSQISHENFNDQTGLVRYFDARIEVTGTMINEAHIVEDVMRKDISSQEKDNQHSKFDIAKAFGKKSKTWTSFYDSENQSVHFQPETELETVIPVDVHHSGRTCENYLRKQVHGEGSNINDDICAINQSKYSSSDDQSQWKYNDHFLDMADEQPGPSNVSQRAKNDQRQALQHAQTAKERLWKYHRNCCDEYQPCKTASKMLNKIKALEQTQLKQKPKQSPPSDEDLLEETPSPPLLPSTLSKDHALAKPAIFSNMACASLPNLSHYGSHQVCASYDAPSLESPIQASDNMDDNTARVTTSADLDLPDICVAHGEKNVSSYNLTVLEDQPESLVRSETELNNALSSILVLPNNDAPAVYVVEGEARLDVRLVSNLALPIINAQTEAKSSRNVNNLSASQLKLPIISEPPLGVAVQKTSLENIKMKNIYLPVVAFHKIKSLPAIKILEEVDNVRDSQSLKPKISSNKIITKADPEGDENFENQDLKLNLEIKPQKSKILSEPYADGVSTNDVNNMAAISSSASTPLFGVIPNHGKVTTGENECTPPQEPPELSNVSFNTQSNLTTSVSYSNSIQDSEEVSDWPKIADLVKHSSTISLSSNFDILNYRLVPYFNGKLENSYEESKRSNTDFNVDKCERAEAIDDQPCDIEDHRNTGLSFKCDVLQQNIENEDRKSLNDIQEETSQNDGNSSEEKGHNLTTTFNNSHSEEHRGQEDLSNHLTCPPNAKCQTSEAEDPLPQTNTKDIRNWDLSSTVITDESADFEGYKEERNERICSNLCIVDINHDAENFEDISKIFQDILRSDSTSVSEKIRTQGSKMRDGTGAEISSDCSKTTYENDDFRESEHQLKGNDYNFDESVNSQRKAAGDAQNCIEVCNSDAAFNNGWANRGGATDASLCNTEMAVKINERFVGIQKVSKTNSKHVWSNQKSQTNRPSKKTNKGPPENAEAKSDLKDYLSSRVNRRPFHSVFTFSASNAEGETVKNPTIEGEPPANDSDPTRPSLVLSDGYTENMTMEAVEYLTYLYARGQKPSLSSLQGGKVSDLDDISVLANLHFCKVALPGEKQEMPTEVREDPVDPKVGPSDPEQVYIPPSKEELKTDDELAVLHVIYTLKRSLELSHNEMETE